MKGPVSVGISRPHVQLSQGTVVVGAIFGAWILWLATNNKLVVYWAILTGKGGNTGGYNPMIANPSGGTAAPPGASSGGAGQTPGSDPTAPMVIPGGTTPQPASLAPSSPIAIQSGAGPFTGGF